MRLSLEEMNLLSEQLEKEKVRLHQQFSESTDRSGAQRALQLISHLQKKFRDCQAKLTLEEKQLLNQLLKDEINHIHGHGTDTYQSILAKIEEEHC